MFGILEFTVMVSYTDSSLRETYPRLCIFEIIPFGNVFSIVGYSLFSEPKSSQSIYLSVCSSMSRQVIQSLPVGNNSAVDFRKIFHCYSGKRMWSSAILLRGAVRDAVRDVGRNSATGCCRGSDHPHRIGW